MFDTREEAAMRLDGTIIQGPSGPVYVKNMESSWKMIYREFLKTGGISNRSKWADLNEGLFSIKPFPLGYMNRDATCYYLQRMPVRKYKQGLHDGALRVVLNDRGRRVIKGRFSFIYEGTGFIEMYFGKYPSVSEIKRGIDNRDCSDRAFGREWALGRRDEGMYTLYYKGNNVGVYTGEKDGFVLNDNRKYLIEALMEVTA